MFEPFDPQQFWKDHQDAYDRKVEKLRTFQPGDRVTKPWFGKNIIYIHGIFIEATDETHCKVKWENEDEVDSLVPVSMINHA